ncbi:MAG: hypothetical protein ACKO96_23000 [Flammeovirgaceae bacterium]
MPKKSPKKLKKLSKTKPKKIPKSSEEVLNDKRREAMHRLLEKLKEIELAFYLSPKLTETQTDLLVRNFTDIVKNEGIPDWTKEIKKIDGEYYLV